MRLRTIISLFCVLMLSLQTAPAQIKVLSREKLEQVASPGLSADSAALSFDTRYIKADPIKEDDQPGIYRFLVENVSESEVELLRVNTTCSCVTATPGQNRLSPGEKTYLTVRHDPKGRLGRSEYRIFIYTCPGTSPSAILRLATQVESRTDMSDLYQLQMGSIRLRSSEVVFRKGQKGVETLKFLNSDDKPLKLECESMFLPEYLTFEASPEVTAPGGEGEIIVRYQPEKEETRTEIPLILKGLGVPPGKSTIKIRIE